MYWRKDSEQHIKDVKKKVKLYRRHKTHHQTLAAINHDKKSLLIQCIVRAVLYTVHHLYIQRNAYMYLHI